MQSSTRIRLLEVDPDLGGSLGVEEFAEARQLAVPVVTIERPQDDLAELAPAAAFGALVVAGMVFGQLRVADQRGMRLFGPGDIVALNQAPPSMLVGETALRALPNTRLALLGRELMFAAGRWPSLLAGLQSRAAQQADRLTTQLVICQLPRVDQRLLALFWLLAESWGSVTLAGTALPLKLTHEALGALIGARRPTVSLALRDLTERGAIIRQTEGWLLLEPPPDAGEAVDLLRDPALIETGSTSWAEKEDPRSHAAAPQLASRADYTLLRETLDRLRRDHQRNRDQFNEQLRTLTSTRERCRESRRRIARERVRRPPRRSQSS